MKELSIVVVQKVHLEHFAGTKYGLPYNVYFRHLFTVYYRSSYLILTSKFEVD